MRSIKTPYIFVYGTLKRGFKIKESLVFNKIAKFIDIGSTNGQLFSVEEYPALVHPHSRSRVKGEMFRFKNIDKGLKLMDVYEHAFIGEKEYVRSILKIKTHSSSSTYAHVYLYNKPSSKLTMIPQGEFFAKKKR